MGDGPMTTGHVHPANQPGQRALRLVALPQEGTAAPTPLEEPSASPTLRRLQRDLEAARAEARSLHELLEELPAILERKFQLRLHALLCEQRQLEQDNALLEGHLMGLLLGGSHPSAHPHLLLDSAEDGNSTRVNDDAPITRGLGLRRALRLRHL